MNNSKTPIKEDLSDQVKSEHFSTLFKFFVIRYAKLKLIAECLPRINISEAQTMAQSCHSLLI